MAETLDVLGTITTAIASTKKVTPKEELNNRLEFIGNVLQASNSALATEERNHFPLEKYGDTIQVVGNSINIYSLLSTSDPNKRRKLAAQGEFFQATGCAIALSYSLNENNIVNIYSDLLQLVGNILQGIGESATLKNLTSEKIIIIGSWIQAIGAILKLIDLPKTVFN